ncbi:flavin reductase [Altibacter sp.]|uniref:flavin reductase family protein n=1 Tax=Altibacter sp. TaxID=2024823 RepID=UPI0025B81EFA|nr:flavin reductase [Altibacter sp.]
MAVFSSVVHLGSDPALLGFIMRPQGEVPRHTYENILATGHYTINHILPSFAERAHYTSGKFPKEVSEFARCGLTEAYIEGFQAPFVQESSCKMGMRFEEAIPIPLNGTTLIIGAVEHLILPETVDIHQEVFDLEATESMGISGLNSYYTLTKYAEYPYVRPHNIPDFDV